MTTYVEVSDEGGVERAAQQLTSLGERLGDCGAPPDPHQVAWGDDEFGEYMRNEYLKAEDSPQPAPDECHRMQQDLATEYGSLGEAVQKTVRTLAIQEMLNFVAINEVAAPDGPAAPSGGAPSGAPASPTSPASLTVSSSAATTQSEDQDGSPEPTPGVVMAGRMFRVAASDSGQDGGGQPESAEPVRRGVAKVRLLRFPAEETAAEEPAAEESNPEDATAEESASEDPATDEADSEDPATEESGTEESGVESNEVATSEEAPPALDRRTFVARLVPAAESEVPAEETGVRKIFGHRVIRRADVDGDQPPPA